MEKKRLIQRQLLPAVAQAAIVHLVLFGVCMLTGIAERAATVAGADAAVAFSLADMVTAVHDGSRQPEGVTRETVRPARAAAPSPQPAAAPDAVPLPTIRKARHLRQSDAGVQASSSLSADPGRGEARAPVRQPPAGMTAAPAMREEAVVAARPRYRDNPPPEYPHLARRRGWQGRVLLDVTVLADGSVGEIRLDQSSSYDLLDRVAVMTVRSWLFTPERRDGRPVKAKVKIPVRFALNE